MAEHPIDGLMKTAMQSIKEMVDVNTILGDAVETADGTVIIPVSRVSFGFAAGGSEFTAGEDGGGDQGSLPFGGGSGAGISLSPVAFVVVSGGEVKLLPVDGGAILDRLIDVVPKFVDKLRNKDRDVAGGPAVPPVGNRQGAMQ